MLKHKPVKSFILQSPEPVHGWLNSQEQQLISEVQPEFQAVLTRPVVEHSVHKRHYGCFQIDLIHVLSQRTKTPVQVINQTLNVI